MSSLFYLSKKNLTVTKHVLSKITLYKGKLCNFANDIYKDKDLFIIEDNTLM